ncbi:MAG: DUF1416 domain-containing protein [Actinoallomurus sp.]
MVRAPRAARHQGRQELRRLVDGVRLARGCADRAGRTRLRLHGRVSNGGQPVEGAYVQLIGPSGEFTAEVRTDESGRFLFYPIPGAWSLRVSLPGGAHREKLVNISDGQSVDVQLSEDDDGEASPPG